MSTASQVSFAEGVRPLKIYAYTTAQYEDKPWRGGREGRGLIKVGDTTRPDAVTRIVEQLEGVLMPDAPEYKVLVVESAITDVGEAIRDHVVHTELVRAGVHRVLRDGKPTEWFECTAEEVRGVIQRIKAGQPVESLRHRHNFPLRKEQAQAIEQTAAHFKANSNKDKPPHFLWNAKMRFGKTFTTYQVAKRMGWTRILVLTYKPAVEHAWREDLESHVDFDGWRFKGKNDPIPDLTDPAPLVWFASFQDVLGTDEEGRPKAKNQTLYDVDWDVLVIDEYHFGAWRDAARELYLRDTETGAAGDPSEKSEIETPDLEEDFVANLEEVLDQANLSIAHYLYLSGTPFRAIAQGEFLEHEIFDWTYSDEQRAKEEAARRGGDNPYASLPKMHLLVYEMPEKLRQVALNNMSEFSLTEFFKTEKSDGRHHFVHERDVQKWLAMIRGQDIDQLWASVSNQQRPPLPYEDTNLLRALQHTVWYLPSVAACEAMADQLREPHNGFHDYKIIVAAGQKAGIGQKALEPVREAIGHDPQLTKTITLTCGKLLTGVTVPAWTGIFMLRELKSPESYFQAAFRVQSPWVTRFVDSEEGGEKEHIHKEHCYVFDFSPNRALQLIVDYATRLRSDTTASQRDDEAAIAEFMEFLPVLSFDGFQMSHLQAADVIHYLTKGISASMLARRWNSPELLKLDLKAMEAILANEELLESLEQIELFRNIRNDLTAVISSTRELGQKAVSREKLTDEEKRKKKETAERRFSIRDKLQRFLTRIPAFMYLTDDREKAVKDIIEQVEPELFRKVTGLTLKDFKMLVDAGVFNDSKMNDAVWKFREFEAPSLKYGALGEELELVGGWDEIRNADELAEADA